MEQKRQYTLDLLRILACFMVLILHVSGYHFKEISPETGEWQVFNVYNTLVRSSVPLFFMISGKLFLSREDVSLKKLFSKNIAKLAFVYILWSLLYAVDKIGIASLISSPDFSRLFIVTAASKYHLWYLPALISVYLLIPVFISMKSYKDGKILNYAAALFFVFAIVMYNLQFLPIKQVYKDFLQQFSFSFDSYCGYFLLGYLLDKYKEKLNKIPSLLLLLVFLIAVTATAAGTQSLSVKAGVGIGTLYNNFFISTFAEAVILFILFLKLPQFHASKAMGTLIQKVSAYTFFIYLSHPLLMEYLDSWFGLTALSFNPLLSVPSLSLLLFVLGTILAFVIDRIPGVRKILL